MKTATLFRKGRSHWVRLPREFRFEGDHVLIKKSGAGVLLLPAGVGWDPLVRSLSSSRRISWQIASNPTTACLTVSLEAGESEGLSLSQIKAFLTGWCSYSRSGQVDTVGVQCCLAPNFRHINCKTVTMQIHRDRMYFV